MFGRYPLGVSILILGTLLRADSRTVPRPRQPAHQDVVER
jgi:hypothetical protein